MLSTNERLILPETLELQQLRCGIALGRNQRNTPISDPLENSSIAALIEKTSGALQVYRGKRPITSSTVPVLISGGVTTGDINGTYFGYDYNDIFQIYKLTSTVPAEEWFRNYVSSSDNQNLKSIFEKSSTKKLSYQLKFTLYGNNEGVVTVFIYYDIIRITMDGQTKDYMVTNPASSGAVTPGGVIYPGYSAESAPIPEE
ncbi:hypothetical protein [Kocuria rosea]|uniref:hypothetical protein n=1 Tax=Kocuria rosea TaxID=1275 RepID=UPI000AD15775|nr:hypothetical protein [Kocuria polaris]